MHSLSRRLLVSVSVPLALFFGLTVVVLDGTFRNLADRALRDLLDAQMVALIAAAEPQDDGRVAPIARGLETRLQTPGSGLYAQIGERDGSMLWRSASTAGTFVDLGSRLAPGERSFRVEHLRDGSRVAVASRGIAFQDESGGDRALTFSVAASLAPYESQLWGFRRQLFGWFVGLAVLLLATLGVLLRWVLEPVRRLEHEIDDVEAGRREVLGSGYPRELAGVAGNLNALLVGERRRVVRYRDTLGNLAHSLKTPLAVMRASIADRRAGEGAAQVLEAEIDRMSGIIERQLNRAAASGGGVLGQAAVPVMPVVAELRGALLRVYGGSKDLGFEVVAAPDATFDGDRADLTEVLGNLLDNACKWCRSRVRVTVHRDAAAPARQRLHVTVEDDGPGIREEDRPRVLERGIRADEQAPGHGLGLAMVRDTVELHGGTVSLGASSLGGARIELRLPGR